MELKINYLQHTGIPVTDLVASKVFYERLGFANVMETRFEYGSAYGKVAMMKRDLIIIELYEMPAAELDAIRARSNGHIDHIAFDVDDVDDTFALLKSNGFNVLEAAPVFLPFWKHGCKYFNITGPDGERLEFNQVLKQPA